MSDPDQNFFEFCSDPMPDPDQDSDPNKVGSDPQHNPQLCLFDAKSQDKKILMLVHGTLNFFSGN